MWFKHMLDGAGSFSRDMLVTGLAVTAPADGPPTAAARHLRALEAVPRRAVDSPPEPRQPTLTQVTMGNCRGASPLQLYTVKDVRVCTNLRTTPLTGDKSIV